MKIALIELRACVIADMADPMPIPALLAKLANIRATWVYSCVLLVPVVHSHRSGEQHIVSCARKANMQGTTHLPVPIVLLEHTLMILAH